MPTDPTPTPTPREVLAPIERARRNVLGLSLCQHHPDAEPGQECEACLSVVAEFESEVRAHERAALAATGDAPLAAEEVERAAREIVDDLFPDYRHADGGVGRSYQNMVIQRLTIALGSVRPILCGTLAAQLAAARAERDKWSAGCVAEMRRNEQLEAERDALREANTGWQRFADHAPGCYGDDQCHCGLTIFRARHAAPARPTDTGREG